MSDLRDLYQEMILDHGKRPRNHHPLDDADHRADGHNPLCGDKITVFLKLDGDTVKEVTFSGSGCAISQASASMMTEAMVGKTLAEARELFGTFHSLVTGAGAADDEALGKLVVFSGVRDFPVRVKCASIAWHTMQAALKQEDEAITTE
jgi:nitrogen fixation NifU-like protein